MRLWHSAGFWCFLLCLCDLVFRLGEEVGHLFLRASPPTGTRTVPGGVRDLGYNSLQRRLSVLDRLVQTHAVWLQLGLSHRDATQILQSQPSGVSVAVCVWCTLTFLQQPHPGPAVDNVKLNDGASLMFWCYWWSTFILILIASGKSPIFVTRAFLRTTFINRRNKVGEFRTTFPLHHVISLSQLTECPAVLSRNELNETDVSRLRQTLIALILLIVLEEIVESKRGVLGFSLWFSGTLHSWLLNAVVTELRSWPLLPSVFSSGLFFPFPDPSYAESSCI